LLSSPVYRTPLSFSLFSEFNYQYSRKTTQIRVYFYGSNGERQLRRLWRFLGWFVVVDALITIFGVTTAPLLLAFAADAVVGLLIIRDCFAIRDALLIANNGLYDRLQ
jgi:hypothetical protein